MLEERLKENQNRKEKVKNVTSLRTESKCDREGNAERGISVIEMI